MVEHMISAVLALSANKTRAALTMLGVVIGVLAVTLLVSVGDGARAYLNNTLSGIGSNLLSVVPGRTETRGFGPPAQGLARPLTMDDYLARPGVGDRLASSTSSNINANAACRDFVFTGTAQATFDPNTSWFRDPKNASAALLRHEQLHFDIT